jgi:hypothetical protein
MSLRSLFPNLARRRDVERELDDELHGYLDATPGAPPASNSAAKRK